MKRLLPLLLLWSAAAHADGVDVVLVFPAAPDPNAPIIAALFADAQSFDQRTGPLRDTVLEPSDGASEWRLSCLAPGEYAVLAYQDTNGNGELDFDERGLPVEPYAASGRKNRRAPKFVKAAIQLTGDAARVELNRWTQHAPRSRRQ